MSGLTKKEITDLLNFDDGDFLVFDLDATVAMNEAVLHQLTQPLNNILMTNPKPITQQKISESSSYQP